MLQMTLRVNPDSARPNDPLTRLGPIVLSTPLLNFHQVDGGISDSTITIGGRRFLVTDVAVDETGTGGQSITIEVAPADDDPFEETRDSDRRQEW